MSKTLALALVLGGLAGTAYADLPDPPVADDPIPTADPPPAPVPVTDPTPTVEPAPVTSTYVEPTISTVPIDEGVSAYAWTEPRLQSGIGVGVTVGGGITGFTDKTMRDTVSTDVGGLWDARVSLGTHIPIGLDLSYLGSAANVHSLVNGMSNGTLVGTTTEAALRWNVLPHELVTPYLFGGVGWQRYDLQNPQQSVADAAMRHSDNVLEIPMGAGLALRQTGGFTLDARGTFRAQATSSDLVLDTQTGQYAKLHSWEASANLGYEF